MGSAGIKNVQLAKLGPWALYIAFIYKPCASDRSNHVQGNHAFYTGVVQQLCVKESTAGFNERTSTSHTVSTGRRYLNI